MTPSPVNDFGPLKDSCVAWVREWFENNGPSSSAVIGMSGGKDSTVAAAVCAEALGADRVYGVALPSVGQGLNDADKICDYLGIHFICLPIAEIDEAFGRMGIKALPSGFSSLSLLNIPPRIRMTALYAVAQSVGGMVANTCNLSEDYIGYATLFGDAAGSFSPLGKLCAREVRGIGHAMGIPSIWVDKTPDDGLPGSCPDEEKFGFRYDTLDRYIREGICEDPEIKAKIDSMHSRNAFKTQILHIPSFEPVTDTIPKLKIPMSMYCKFCGAEIDELTVICPKCGRQVAEIHTTTVYDVNTTSQKSRLVTLLLCTFLGSLGIHRFYCNRVASGIAMILTIGGLGLWTLIDWIVILTGNFKDNEGKIIRNWGD